MTAEIEDAFADGATIADMAKANGLSIETSPKLFANGQNTSQPRLQANPRNAGHSARRVPA